MLRKNITIVFFFLVLLAATQDIAVDGWALTLLSKGHVGYASTCQTIGMNIGYFLSFTVFLALNDPDFCNSYFRSTPQSVGIITLASYLKFWGCTFAIITLLVALLKSGPELQFGVAATEDGIQNEDEQWPDFGCEGIKVQRAHQPTSQCQGKTLRQFSFFQFYQQQLRILRLTDGH
eukprot:TRINITY_DN15874_c0_g1_i1.p2 TRINITY_DN15874_c0_g1~~TRINITY_DN15874_c0_g1_i1.p2  ORF type:complete len:177 (-),score=24.74 TRINITY_DN15874_c0_g1_i1:496-1026(-)